MEKSPANRTSPNAGLMDQRFALKWVQRHIHRFGGDAKRVTITGQSAGGGSVELHTVAYGGSRRSENTLFRGAIAQSPAPILVDPKWQTIAANGILHAAGARSVDELRTKSTEVLAAAAQKAQEPAPFTVEFFGKTKGLTRSVVIADKGAAPTVDGDLIPDLERRLYRQGRFVKGINVMASHNANEVCFGVHLLRESRADDPQARLLANQSTAQSGDFDIWVSQNFPSASRQIQDYITQILYPPRYGSGSLYTTPQERADLAVKEYLIACNTVAMADAYGGRVHDYDFSIGPAIHSQDLVYTYYNGQDNTQYLGTAIALQKAIAQFVLTGDPNGPGQSVFPLYGTGSKVLNFVPSGTQQIVEPAENPRCTWWLQGLYAPRASSLGSQNSSVSNGSVATS